MPMSDHNSQICRYSHLSLVVNHPHVESKHLQIPVHSKLVRIKQYYDDTHPSVNEVHALRLILATPNLLVDRNTYMYTHVLNSTI